MGKTIEIDIIFNGLRCVVMHIQLPEPEATQLRSYGINDHWYTGYVGVPPTHPLRGKDYYTPNVWVHGGLTFAADTLEGVDAPDLWWFGFDCNHAGDDPRYEDLAYATRECESLARQLAKTRRFIIESVTCDPFLEINEQVVEAASKKEAEDKFCATAPDNTCYTIEELPA